MTITLDQPTVADCLRAVGASGGMHTLPGGRLLAGCLAGPRLPIRPSLVRGGRVVVGLSVAHRVVFIGRLATAGASR